jgi:hypothetical protein
VSSCVIPDVSVYKTEGVTEMTQKKSNKRRTKVQKLSTPVERLGAGELKKVRGGMAAPPSTTSQLASAAKQLDSLTQGGGPTAAQNQKIQE